MLGKSLFFLPGLLLATFSQSIVLPPPPGPTNVYVTQFPLTDISRYDLYAPCCAQPRQLMLTLFQPANCSETKDIPYVPPATAAYHDQLLSSFGLPSGIFESFSLRTCPEPPKDTDFPLLLFSPGLRASRLSYGVLLQWVASLGFNVVAIDHTYDADIVEFLDGTVIEGVNLTETTGIPASIALRTPDISSVLNALSNNTVIKQLGIPALRTDCVGMFGHSLGGALAADVMLGEPRIVGGLNMDGGAYGEASFPDRFSYRPFTMFAAEGHNQSSVPYWTEFWPNLLGPKWQLEVSGTAHISFSDFPIVANSIGIDATVIPEIGPTIGTINGTRLFEILRSYIGEFFGDVLESKQSELLQEPSPEFPEVTFANFSSGSTAQKWPSPRLCGKKNIKWS